MKLEERLYYYHNGKMKLFSQYRKTYNVISISKPIERWYRNNPYAKKLDDGWICSDYRIDQQRPQRNVYSEGYLRFVEITEQEERCVDNLIKRLEDKIDYPTVWDDGERRYYEETIYCPNCHERRKVLTSKSHCEFCGFEFDEALICSECGTMNLKGSDECWKCHHKFRKKSFINNDDFVVKKDDEKQEKLLCPICKTRKSKYYDKCRNCGFDYVNKKQCIRCGEWVDENDKFCQYCGQRLNIFVECKGCGKKNNIEHNYCSGCGVRL